MFPLVQGKLYVSLQGPAAYASYRVVYSVLLMHRRTDLWGPDGQFSRPCYLVTSDTTLPLKRSNLIRIDSWTKGCKNTS